MQNSLDCTTLIQGMQEVSVLCVNLLTAREKKDPSGICMEACMEAEEFEFAPLFPGLGGPVCFDTPY